MFSIKLNFLLKHEYYLIYICFSGLFMVLVTPGLLLSYQRACKVCESSSIYDILMKSIYDDT